MSKKDKYFFGIYVDGPEIKVAKLRRESKDLIYIEQIFKKTLPQDINSEEKDILESDFLDSIGYDDELGSSNGTAEDFIEESELQAPEENSGIQQVQASTANTLKELAEENTLYDGEISLNMDVSNVKYRNVFVSSTKRKKIINTVKNDFIDDGIIPSVCDYVNLSDTEEEVIGISYQGKLDFVEHFLSAAEIPPQRSFTFNNIQTNEIALLNAIRYNYDIEKDSFSAIFYVGIDYSRVLLTKGNDFYMALPIINEGKESENIIQTIYSRFLLEKSHNEIPELDNIFISGEAISAEMIEYLENNQENANIQYLLPNLIEKSQPYDDEELTEYIIPIMLAAKAMMNKNQRLIHTNFIPKNLLQQQNTFSIGISGFLVIALILAASLFTFKTFLDANAKNRKLKSNITTAKQQIQVNKTILDSLINTQNEIDRLNENIAVVGDLLGEENQWHFILYRLSDFLDKNKTTWINSLKKEDGAFTITGTTSKRSNLPKLSMAFPKSDITQINKREFKEAVIWDFSMKFGYPNATETKRKNTKLIKNNVPLITPKITQKEAEKIAEPKVEKIKKEIPKKVVKTEQKETVKPRPKKPVEDNNYQKDTFSSLFAKHKSQFSPYQKRYLKKIKNKTYAIGILNYYIQENQEAINYFEKYIKNNDDLFVYNSHYFVGECNYKLEKYKAAIEQFEIVYKAGKRKVPESLIMLGNSYSKLKNKNKAENYYKQLINNFPNHRLAKIAKNKLK